MIPRWRGHAGGDDRGAATVFALALLGVLLQLGLVAAAVAQQALTRQHVALAADIAAVAAAQSADDPCGRAARAAAVNGVELTGCLPDGPDIVVAVSAPAPPVVRRLLEMLGHQAADITVSARAGPPG